MFNYSSAKISAFDPTRITIIPFCVRKGTLHQMVIAITKKITFHNIVCHFEGTSHRAEHSSRRKFRNYSKRRNLLRKNSNQPMKSQHFSARQNFETNQQKSKNLKFRRGKNPNIEKVIKSFLNSCNSSIRFSFVQVLKEWRIIQKFSISSSYQPPEELICFSPKLPLQSQ